MKRIHNRDVEAAVKQAVEHATPDILDRVLSDCAQQKGNVIVMTQPVKRRSPLRAVIGIAAAFALVIAAGAVGISAYRHLENNVAATVSIDVNPSFEIAVNRDERVLSVAAQNADAQKVIGTMELAGSDLEVAVNALVGSMLKNGYLSDTANSILITVDGENAQELQQTLSAQVSDRLKTDQFVGAVLSQQLIANDELKALAEQHSISLGKARLIQILLTSHPDLSAKTTFAELAGLSINELNLLIGEAQDATLNISGTASDKSYIGLEAAKQAALAHAGLSEASFQKCTLDYEDGVMVYDLKFFVKTEYPFGNGMLYEYEIHAVTGAVVEYESEPITLRGEQPETNLSQAGSTVGNNAGSTTSPSAPTASRAVISVQEAKAIALQLVGLQESDIVGFECELDREDGVTHYEIEFLSGNTEYELEINAYTGAILKQDKEFAD